VFERVADLVSEHAELEHALADPAVHSDPEKARTLGRRYAELTPIVQAYREWQRTSADEQAARELAVQDASFAAEADQLPPAVRSSRSSCAGCLCRGTRTTGVTPSSR
jgi:peptide chain release factor 1